MQDKVDCSGCNGLGYDSTGMAEHDHRMGNWGKNCRRCGGSGKMKNPEPCPLCQGAGAVEPARNG
jgi:DnaJ-class molecular chaperone